MFYVVFVESNSDSQCGDDLEDAIGTSKLCRQKDRSLRRSVDLSVATSSRSLASNFTAAFLLTVRGLFYANTPSMNGQEGNGADNRNPKVLESSTNDVSCGHSINCMLTHQLT